MTWPLYEERAYVQMGTMRRWVIAGESLACFTQIYICTWPGVQVTSAIMGPVCGWLAWAMWRRIWPDRLMGWGGLTVSDIRLVHYGLEPITELHSEWRQSGFMKPAGLWLSVEGGEDGYGWSDWCEAEEWPLGPVEHEITLADDANILWLTTNEDLHTFTETYGRLTYPEWEGLRTHMDIDWARVAREWQGIIITPYLWLSRLDPKTWWYYGWDCASGCIWDVAAVASLKVSKVSEVSEDADR